MYDRSFCCWCILLSFFLFSNKSYAESFGCRYIAIASGVEEIVLNVFKQVEIKILAAPSGKIFKKGNVKVFVDTGKNSSKTLHQELSALNTLAQNRNQTIRIETVAPRLKREKEAVIIGCSLAVATCLLAVVGPPNEVLAKMAAIGTAALSGMSFFGASLQYEGLKREQGDLDTDLFSAIEKIKDGEQPTNIVVTAVPNKDGYDILRKLTRLGFTEVQ